MKKDTYGIILGIILGAVIGFCIIGLINSVVADDSTKKPVSPPTTPTTISLTQPEKQPFIDILNNFDSALKSKQLAETQMENAQLKLKIAVEELKKLKGCGDCQFDLQKLELIKPEKKDEKKEEVKKDEVKPKP